VAHRILVVDDDAAIRGVMVEALGDEGYEVREAADGAEALGVLGSWPADCVVLDLMMPVMDGWAFRRKQLEDPDLRGIPVVVVSAARNVGPGGAELRPTAMLPKPFDIEVLSATVAKALG